MEYYVPWDIAYVDKVLAFIKAWLGPTIIVGAICFCTVFGVILIASIVRRFLHM